MDASSKIQRSIHDVRLTYKYVSRIWGTYHRYALIINDSQYIELQTELKIPNSQYRCIRNDMDIITKEFETYLRGYVKAVKKKRNEKEPLYRESSLINFSDCFDI